MKKYLMILGLAFVALTSCEKDKFSDSIFVDPKDDPNSPTYSFDKWLYQRFVVPYNLEFIYTWNDNASDANYNLVPVTLGKADTIAHLTRYLWFDVYDKVVNEDFLKTYGPRMIQLVGSAAINASQGTEKLGTAEGGIKITLYKINEIDLHDISQLNTYAFHVMHHEFSHILHQTKNYPKEYETLCAGDYDTDGWQNREDSVAWQLGFVTPYGSSQPREDFVEVIATYIEKPYADWDHMMEVAGRSGKMDNGYTGAEIIEQKLSICTTWLKDKFNVDLEALRTEVHSRQDNLDYDKIMHDRY